jgi:hypothetical protein
MPCCGWAAESHEGPFAVCVRQEWTGSEREEKMPRVTQNEGRSATPLHAGFGGVEAPTNQAQAAEGWL